MTVSVSKAPSSVTALKNVLRESFPQYSLKRFGFGKDASIMIAKSSFVGVQISKRDNNITIQGTPPTVLAGIVVFVLSLAGFASYTTAFKNLEKDVASLLYKKLN
jgi:hypothetical protein